MLRDHVETWIPLISATKSAPGNAGHAVELYQPVVAVEANLLTRFTRSSLKRRLIIFSPSCYELPPTGVRSPQYGKLRFLVESAKGNHQNL